MIADMGGIDLQLLGIGFDGHIGFNEPNKCFEKGTHVVALHEYTIKANFCFFASEAEVPKKVITMGMISIMQAKKDILDKAYGGLPPGPLASFFIALVNIGRNISQYITLFDFSSESPNELIFLSLLLSSQNPDCISFVSFVFFYLHYTIFSSLLAELLEMPYCLPCVNNKWGCFKFGNIYQLFVNLYKKRLKKGAVAKL